MKIKGKINEVENKKTIEKIDKTRSLVLGKDKQN